MYPSLWGSTTMVILMCNLNCAHVLSSFGIYVFKHNKKYNKMSSLHTPLFFVASHQGKDKDLQQNQIIIALIIIQNIMMGKVNAINPDHKWVRLMTDHNCKVKTNHHVHQESMDIKFIMIHFPFQTENVLSLHPFR